MANGNSVGLPEGFTLDEPQSPSAGGLPEGFTLDAPQVQVPEAQGLGGEFRGAGASGEFEVPEEPKDFFTRISGRLSQRQQVASEQGEGSRLPQLQDLTDIEDLGDNILESQRKRLRVTGAIAGGINDVTAEGIVSAYRGLVPDDVRAQLSDEVRLILDSDTGKAGIEAIKQGADVYGKWKQQNPDLALDLESILNIAGVATGIKGSQIIKNLRNTAKILNNKIVKNIKKQMPKIVGSSGIKTGLKKFDDNSIEGITEIVKNKGNLSFVDDVGEVVREGKVPHDIQQFLQGIEQTKSSLFNQYDDILRSVTGKGAVIKTDDIVDGLNKLRKHTFVQRNPNILNRVDQQIDFWKKKKNMSLVDMQDELQRINANTFAVKNSADPNIINSHSVDMVIADRMRNSLFSSIKGEKGIQFANLKRKYGSVRSLEDGVANAAKKNRIKSVRGFSDLSDVLTGGTAIYAWSNLNAPLIGAVMGAKTIKTFSDWTKNVNVLTRRMFNTVDKSLKKGATLGGQ